MYLTTIPRGQPLFGGVSYAVLTRGLRVALKAVGVSNAREYTTHAFRRGHARDIAQSGTGLATILGAGQWRSAAFAKYLNKDTLEMQATQAPVAGEESSDEEDEEAEIIQDSDEDIQIISDEIQMYEDCITLQ